MDTFKINETTCIAKDFGFNTVCDLEKRGVTMDDYSETPMSFLRAYVGICMGVSNEVAGKEFEQHLIKGGQFDKAFEVLKRKMEESDFFRALQQNAEKETAQIQEQAVPVTSVAPVQTTPVQTM